MRGREGEARCRGRPGWRFGFGAALLLAGCQGLAAVIPVVADIAGDLLATSAKNYAPEYAETVEELIDALVQAATAEAVANGEPSPPAEPIEIDVGFWVKVHDGDSMRIEPLDDGAVLFTGDRGKVSFRAGTDCHVYVVGIDGSGWATPMFPIASSTVRNPVRAGRDHMIPDDPWWFELDEFPGIEHIFVLASAEAQPELDAVFPRLEGRQRPAGRPTAQVTEQAVIERGFKVVRDNDPVTLSTESGLTEEVDLLSFFSESGGVVVTRWFVHRQP